MLDTSFVITIGNLGSVVALHGPGEIKNKIFLILTNKNQNYFQFSAIFHNKFSYQFIQ
jgi:hypothetical protein